MSLAPQEPMMAKKNIILELHFLESLPRGAEVSAKWVNERHGHIIFHGETKWTEAVPVMSVGMKP